MSHGPSVDQRISHACMYHAQEVKDAPSEETDPVSLSLSIRVDRSYGLGCRAALVWLADTVRSQPSLKSSGFNRFTFFRVTEGHSITYLDKTNNCVACM